MGFIFNRKSMYSYHISNNQAPIKLGFDFHLLSFIDLCGTVHFHSSRNINYFCFTLSAHSTDHSSMGEMEMQKEEGGFGKVCHYPITVLKTSKSIQTLRVRVSHLSF